MFPNKGKLYLASIEDSENKTEKFDFWRNVYDFNMSNI
ncbi:MAG: hypothetical protein ACK52J_00990 [bacterium]